MSDTDRARPAKPASLARRAAPMPPSHTPSGKLAPDVSRILFVKSLPYQLPADELYELFGKFGAVRQIRLGNTAATRGRAFVVYEDVQDAMRAVEHLNGFNLQGRYLVVLYHSSKDRTAAKPKVDTRDAKREPPTVKIQFGGKGRDQ